MCLSKCIILFSHLPVVQMIFSHTSAFSKLHNALVSQWVCMWGFFVRLLIKLFLLTYLTYLCK